MSSVGIDTAALSQLLLTGIVTGAHKRAQRIAKAEGGDAAAILTDSIQRIGENFGFQQAGIGLKAAHGSDTVDAHLIDRMLSNQSLDPVFETRAQFLDRVQLKKLLKTIALENDQTPGLKFLLEDRFGIKSLARVELKILEEADTEEQGDNGVNYADLDISLELDAEDVPKKYEDYVISEVDFPIIFKASPQETFEDLFAKYKSQVEINTFADMNIETTVDVFGKPGEGPEAQAYTLDYSDDSGVSFNIKSNLVDFYMERLQASQKVLDKRETTTLRSVVQITLRKFLSDEISLEDTTNFLIFLEQKAEVFNSEIKQDYEAWYRDWKKAKGVETA